MVILRSVAIFFLGGTEEINCELYALNCFVLYGTTTIVLLSTIMDNLDKSNNPASDRRNLRS
jgi:hypothetical protein